MTVVLEALAREVSRFSALLDQLSDAEWHAPTRCPPMDVMQIAAHVWRGAMRIPEMLAAGAVDDEPEQDGVTYFIYDPAEVSGTVVARAQAAVADFGSPDLLARAFRENWSAALDAARADLASDDRVYHSVFGTMRLSEYLRTRLVEVTVHRVDVCDALEREAGTDPEALEGTADVLRGLLGTDARSLGMPDVRFVLVGTGRAPLGEQERIALGPLADKFPLLA